MSKKENIKEDQEVKSVRMIVSINFLVTMFMNVLLRMEKYALYRYIMLRTAYIPQFWYMFPWSVITATFMHVCVLHLLGNMSILALAGYDVQAKYGSNNFMIIYLLCGIISTFLSPYTMCIGASGAISGIVAIKLAMISDQEKFDFTGTISFVVLYGLLSDILKVKWGMAGTTACVVHIYGSLIGVGIYYLQKYGCLDWILDKNTINNVTRIDQDSVNADEIKGDVRKQKAVIASRESKDKKKGHSIGDEGLTVADEQKMEHMSKVAG